MINPVNPQVTASDRLLTTGEVAALFRVDVKTVTRWANNNPRLHAIRTPGGRFRFREREVLAILNGEDVNGTC